MLMLLAISCAVRIKSVSLTEDELLVSRKYVGNYIGFRYAGPTDFGWPNTVWIKTSMDSLYGKISAYARVCEFRQGEKLYIRRAYESPGISDFWMYQIENDKEDKIWYKLSEFQGTNRHLTDYFR